MRAIGTIAAIGATAFATEDLHSTYAKYLAQHRKNYLTTEEYEHRYQLFAKTHYKIVSHNHQEKSWTLSHNVFSDWTAAEKKKLTGYNAKPIVYTPITEEPYKADDIDWRSLKSVAHVKNQGQCGSCWAFSTTGSIESHTEIANGTYVSLSEQQLVDCSTDNNGCDGGVFDYAFEYAAKNGLEGEADYPYQAVDGTCQFDSDKVKNKKVNKTNPYTDVAAGSSSSFLKQLATGPISIAIEADEDVFQSY